MRQNRDIPRGERLENAVSDTLEEYSELLMISRPGLAGTTPTIRGIYGAPVPVSPSEVARFIAQGKGTYGSSIPHAFWFTADSDIAEKDLIPYDNKVFVVGLIIPGRMRGTTAGLKALCTVQSK